MMISPADLSIYRRTARRRAQSNAVRWADRRERAWAAARRAAAWLHEHYPAATVRVFGSLLYPDSFGPHSDIDLAVEGIDWPDYLRAWNAVELLAPEFHLELIDLAVASPSLKAHIEKEGQTL